MKKIPLTDQCVIMSEHSMATTLNNANIYNFKIQFDMGKMWIEMEDDEATMFELLGGVAYLWQQFRYPKPRVITAEFTLSL